MFKASRSHNETVPQKTEVFNVSATSHWVPAHNWHPNTKEAWTTYRGRRFPNIALKFSISTWLLWTLNMGLSHGRC